MISRVLLLAGGLKASPLAAGCGGSVLTLPVGAGGTLLAHWAAVLREVLVKDDAGAGVHICIRPDQSDGLRALAGAPGMPGSWSDSRTDNAAAEGDASRGPRFILAPDRADFRGPAGVVRDATRDLPPDANVLVVEASRLALTPIRPLIEYHCAHGCDATVGINPDDSPAGLFVIRVAALDLVSDVGFVDLKEQYLPKLVAAKKDVRVFPMAAPAIGVFRTREEFLAIILGSDHGAVHHPTSRGASPGPAALAEDAFVDPTAYVSNSVIGPGVRVEAGAVVVRTIVAGGAVIPAGASISDAIVTKAGVVHDRG